MNKLLFLTFVFLLFLPVSKAQSPVIGNSCPASGQTGITAAGVPVLCTQNGSGSLVWVATTGGGSGGSGSAASNFDLLTPAYGYIPGGTIVGDAVTNGTTTVTSASSNFTSSMIGWSAWALDINGNCNVSVPAAMTHNPVIEGTITAVNSAHSINIGSTNATNSATGNCLVYGPLNDTALTAMDTAMQASLTCPHGVLPFGVILMSAKHFTTDPTSCRGGGAPGIFGSGMELSGQGMSATQLVFVPTFNWASCPSDGSMNACLGGFQSLYFHDFGITGNNAVFSGNTPASPTAIISTGGGNGNQSGLLTRIYCYNIAASASNVHGVDLGLASTMSYSILDACGEPMVLVTGELTYLDHTVINDYIHNGIEMANVTAGTGQLISSFNNCSPGISTANGANCVFISTGGTYTGSQNFYGFGSNAAGNIMIGLNLQGTNPTAILSQEQFQLTTGSSNIAIDLASATAVAKSCQSVFNEPNNIDFSSAGSGFLNTCSNVFLQSSPTPTCTTNCGTGPSVTGRNENMLVTIGTAPGSVSTFTVTFAGTWPAAPRCTGNRATTGTSPTVAGIVTTTTTAVVNLSTTIVASETYSIQCGLYQ